MQNFPLSLCWKIILPCQDGVVSRTAAVVLSWLKCLQAHIDQKRLLLLNCSMGTLESR